jgi:hypothetical protein|tara:strand:+ start:573 stop:767 length:195 start_codon:yes stop_codon:yes gene_type:complete
MDIEQILRERITHELDMDLLREISKVAKVNLEKEIELAERKFNGKLDRVLNNITNNRAHDTDSL